MPVGCVKILRLGLTPATFLSSFMPPADVQGHGQMIQVQTTKLWNYRGFLCENIE